MAFIDVNTRQLKSENNTGVPYSDALTKTLQDTAGRLSDTLQHISGEKSSSSIFSYAGDTLTSEGFEAWLNANYPNLPEHYKNLLYNAFSQYESQSFTPNVWQSIEEGLGFTSSRQNFENQRMQTLSNDIASILNAYHAEDYNDPLKEVSRRRAAGLNDDLSGGSSVGSGTPGQATTPEQDSPALNDMQSSLQDAASFVVNGLINVFSTTMSLAEKFQGLNINSARLASDEISGVSSARSLLVNALSDSFPSDFFTRSWESESDRELQFSKYISDFLNSYTIDTFGLSPRTKKYLHQASSSLRSQSGLGAKTLYEELYNKYLTARQGNVNIRGDYRFSEDFSEWVSKSTDYISQHIKNILSLEDLDVSIKLNEKEFSKYRADKIKSMESVFDGISSLIPKDASWKGFAELLLELLRLSSTQKLFGM